MKDQKYNQGELKNLNINIEKEVVESLEYMSENTPYSKDDLVVIALKRFISHHADYMNVVPQFDID
jgi:hypothetical protein